MIAWPAGSAAAPGEAVAPLSWLPLGERAPFTALLGIPDGWTRADAPGWELAWSIANQAASDASGDEQLLLDGETHLITLRTSHRLGEHLTLGVSLPWVAHGGGFLDGVIDDWHDAFGFSEGIRPRLPRNDLRFTYQHGGEIRYQRDRGTSGPGDLRTSLAWRPDAGSAQAPQFEITADVQWPTGASGKLTGGGDVDVAAGVRLSAPSTDRLVWTLAAGITWPGDTGLPLPAPAGRIVYYDAALGWRASPRLDLLLQLQGHGNGFQTGLDMLGAGSLQLGAGVLWHMRPDRMLRFGIFEDIRTDTAPDFALEIAVLFRR